MHIYALSVGPPHKRPLPRLGFLVNDHTIKNAMKEYCDYLNEKIQGILILIIVLPMDMYISRIIILIAAYKHELKTKYSIASDDCSWTGLF